MGVPTKDWVFIALFVLVVAGIATGILFISLLVYSFLTPTLVDAVKEMPWWEAIFAPKGTFVLWLAVRVFASPINTVTYFLVVACLTLTVLVLKSKL